MPDNHTASADQSGIARRKTEHIELCVEQDVESRAKTTLLEEVHLVHQSLPELDLDELDLGTELFGKALKAPLAISGMTGGTPEAGDINRRLAAVAQGAGFAFGVGSQRPMLLDGSTTRTYQVRDVAPDIVLMGNIGVVQAASATTAQLQDLVGAIDADALCVHMNPAQEMIQARGDRDFRGALDAFARLVEELGVPVVAKETGCGVSLQTALQLRSVGVHTVDVSGSGGTTWVGVETLRGEGALATVGDTFWDWGIPTAASISMVAGAGLQVIASGGLRSGLDAARAIALGASVASMALPFLRALHNGGEEAALAAADTLVLGLKTAMVLTGSRDLDALRAAPRRLGPNLRGWLE